MLVAIVFLTSHRASSAFAATRTYRVATAQHADTTPDSSTNGALTTLIAIKYDPAQGTTGATTLDMQTLRFAALKPAISEAVAQDARSYWAGVTEATGRWTARTARAAYRP
jgi:hypothetical protein